MHFHWDEWNIEHIAEHDVDADEAEEIVKGARSPYPRRMGKAKILVRGATRSGRHLQVIYVMRPVDSFNIEQFPLEVRLLLGEVDTIAYVIHARPLTDAERRAARKGRNKK